MSEIAIRVENLAKRYTIGAAQERHDTLRDALMAPFKRRNGQTKDATEFWALRDVSFEVKRGEVVGIIGRNGAGKSTLLKILSRIVEPTHGRADIYGRVGSLLEVGTGFHPELTGRENIFLNGAILGMKRAEIQAKFDEIVAFAEIEQFLDTPVKRYSSGMYVRLAFAVAAHLEPEILLVDEVLAVGDAAFQKKALGKMGDVVHEGRTVLFVSHNMTAVLNLCQLCTWLDDGIVRTYGPSGSVVDAYLEPIDVSRQSGEIVDEEYADRYGTRQAQITSVRMLDASGNPTSVLRRAENMVVEFDVVSDCTEPLSLSAVVTHSTGERILYLSHHDTSGFAPAILCGHKTIRFVVPTLPLCAGDFRLTLGLHNQMMAPIDVVRDVLRFKVDDPVDGSNRPYRIDTGSAYCWTPSIWSIK